MVDLVIFDCDGVLVDSEPIANRILARELTRIGLPTTTEQSVKTYMGRSVADCGRLIARSLGHELPNDFWEELGRKDRAAFERELRPIPGIRFALENLRIPCCVASSGNHEKIRRNLKLTGLRSFFSDDRIFSAVDVEHGKPSPDLFLMAAEKMEARPERCVVVEDSVPGIIAAKNAGMMALGYRDLTPESDLRQNGAVVFDNMKDLPGLISGQTETLSD